MKAALVAPMTLAVLFGLTLFLVPADATPPVMQAQNGNPNNPPIVVVGGSAPNVQDLCWVLFNDKAQDSDGKVYNKYALCLYKANNNGRMLHFVDMRELTYDIKPSQLGVKGRTDPSPRDMKRMWEEALEKQEKDKKSGRRSRSGR